MPEQECVEELSVAGLVRHMLWRLKSDAEVCAALYDQIDKTKATRMRNAAKLFAQFQRELLPNEEPSPVA